MYSVKQSKRWNALEEEQLINEIKSNIKLNEIIKKHNRSNKAITIRLFKIALLMVRDKKIPIETVSNDLKININVLRNTLQRIEFYDSIIKTKEPLLVNNFDIPANANPLLEINQKVCDTSNKCKRCLKYETILNKFLFDVNSIKQHKKTSNLHIFDIYSDSDNE